MVGEVYMYTHHVYMYMYLALMAMSYMYRYSMCAIRDQSTDICITLRVHTEYMKQGRELFSLSLQHFITSPIVFSHNLTLLLSLTPSFHYILPPNIDGYILKQRQVYCIYCTSMKTFSKNVEGCRDGSAKNHRN